MAKKSNYNSFQLSSLLFIISLSLMFIAVSREAELIQTSQISVPSFSGSGGDSPGSSGIGDISDAVTIHSTGIPVLYFFFIAALLGVILYFIPISRLKLTMRILFGLAYAWGTFIYFGLLLPFAAALVLALVISLAWLLVPRVWLHNLLLVLMLVSMATVFGVMFSPWTIIVIMLVVSIYDYFAVRYGYMQWMAKKLSETEVLPAFFIPEHIADWKTDLKRLDVNRLFEETAEKPFSLLGGGDIFFPLLLVASVWFASGIAMSLIVAAFSLTGIALAYVIHVYFMKNRATPALPPVFFASLCGLLLVRFIFTG